MDIYSLGMKELLFIFLNVKGIKGTEVCKKGDEVPDKFILETTMKKMNDDDIVQFIKKLNEYFHFEEHFERDKTKKICLEFYNNEKYSISEFLDIIYGLINKKQISMSTQDISKYFAICSFCYRGSLDWSMNWYTSDLHSSRVSTYKDIQNFMKLTVLTDYNNQLNFNFRELQGEGTKRATQFRMNLKYFYLNYADELSKVNPFRYNQLKKREKDLSILRISKGNTSFLKRIKFYLDNIIDKKDYLDDISIKSLRKKLEFSDDDNNDNYIRSNKAKEFAILTKPQECAGCYKEYNKSDRTFKMRDSDMWYFEMHHVISFANSKDGLQTENSDNYVKLCPICHRALTPNRAEKNYQYRIINNIFEHDKDSLEFVKKVQEKVNSNVTPNDFVYSHLR